MAKAELGRFPPRSPWAPNPAQALSPGEQAWVEYVARTLSVHVPEVRVDLSTPDVAYAAGTILLGKKFLMQKPGTFVRLQKLTHELLHHAGVRHDDEARRNGIHSRPERDRFTRELTRRLRYGA